MVMELKYFSQIAWLAWGIIQPGMSLALAKLANSSTGPEVVLENWRKRHLLYSQS
jgi:hypothetical protein